MKKKKKIGFDLKREYKESWNYIKESRNLIYFAIGIFFLFVLVGFFVPAPAEISEKILEMIKELLEETEGKTLAGLIWFIFANNTEASFLGMLLGILFGIFPVLTMIVNGYVLGFVALASVQAEGAFSLWRIFPHGIFELPAVFISMGMGIKLGMFLFQKKKLEYIKNSFWNSIRVFLFVILPLLVAAAIIEGVLIFLER